jgi:hypothetical protein
VRQEVGKRGIAIDVSERLTHSPDDCRSQQGRNRIPNVTAGRREDRAEREPIREALEPG